MCVCVCGVLQGLAEVCVCIHMCACCEVQQASSSIVVMVLALCKQISIDIFL